LNFTSRIAKPLSIVIDFVRALKITSNIVEK